MSTTYERIKELADKKGVKLGRIEKELGFSNGSLSKKTNNTTLERYKALANYFDVSIDYLVGLTDKPDYNQEFWEGQIFETYLKQLGWSAERTNYSSGKPCSECIERQAVPLGWEPAEKFPDGNYNILCDHCYLEDEHYILSNGELTFNVSTKDYNSFQKKVRDLCISEIRNLIEKALLNTKNAETTNTND